MASMIGEKSPVRASGLFNSGSNSSVPASGQNDQALSILKNMYEQNKTDISGWSISRKGKARKAADLQLQRIQQNQKTLNQAIKCLMQVKHSPKEQLQKMLSEAKGYITSTPEEVDEFDKQLAALAAETVPMNIEYKLEQFKLLRDTVKNVRRQMEALHANATDLDSEINKRIKHQEPSKNIQTEFKEKISNLRQEQDGLLKELTTLATRQKFERLEGYVERCNTIHGSGAVKEAGLNELERAAAYAHSSQSEMKESYKIVNETRVALEALKPAFQKTWSRLITVATKLDSAIHLVERKCAEGRQAGWGEGWWNAGQLPAIAPLSKTWYEKAFGSSGNAAASSSSVEAEASKEMVASAGVETEEKIALAEEASQEAAAGAGLDDAIPAEEIAAESASQDVKQEGTGSAASSSAPAETSWFSRLFTGSSINPVKNAPEAATEEPVVQGNDLEVTEGATEETAVQENDSEVTAEATVTEELPVEPEAEVVANDVPETTVPETRTYAQVVAGTSAEDGVTIPSNAFSEELAAVSQ